MPIVIENNGEITWGRIATCPQCGEEWESHNDQTPDGGIEICDDCDEMDYLESLAESKQSFLS